MNSIHKNVVISPSYQGERIDVVLAKLFSEYSRSQLSQWLKQGLITVNGNILKPKEKVYGGEEIALNINTVVNQEEIAAQNIPLDIIYEDEHILIVNKPAGLVVHQGAGNPDQTLVNALLYHDPNLSALPRAGIVHRLDKDTTGLLIVGKTLPSYTALVRAMQDHLIKREYLALVFGHIISGDTLETFYGRHPRNRLKMAVTHQGKTAITQYTILKQYQLFTLLNVNLMTGRTHQIRVHMAHLNHPIVGDPLYGGRNRIPANISDDVKNRLHQFRRQALHAYRLQLVHPQSGEALTFTTKIPDDFQSLITTLDNHFASSTR